MENLLIDRAIASLLNKEIKISNTLLDLTHMQGKVIDISVATNEMYRQSRLEKGSHSDRVWPQNPPIVIRIKIQGKWGDTQSTDWFYLEEEHVNQLIDTLEL